MAKYEEHPGLCGTVIIFFLDMQTQQFLLHLTTQQFP